MDPLIVKTCGMFNPKIAVFPGSFDPFTKGHEALVKKALPLYEEIIIAIGVNTTKSYYFDLALRLAHIKSIFKEEKKVLVKSYQGLTTELCKQENAGVILRGLRDGKDFEYEKSIAQMNKVMLPQVETVFLLSDPVYGAYNSVIVREILKNNGAVDDFVSNPEVLNSLK